MLKIKKWLKISKNIFFLMLFNLKSQYVKTQSKKSNTVYCVDRLFKSFSFKLIETKYYEKFFLFKTMDII